jgi:phage gpG-like protein
VTPDELPGYLDRLRQKIEEKGPVAAANAMAQTFQNAVVGVELVRSSHAPGTRTTAPPGGPPAAVTGSLRRSIRMQAAVSTGSGKAKSSVAPHIKYARIQELGGTVTARHTFTDKDGKVRPGFLRWMSAGKAVFKHSVTLPARPYMSTTHRRTVADGSLRNAAAKAVRGLIP